jgi:hypothetical protein
MERVTKRAENGKAYMVESFASLTTGIWLAIDKLADYEDAEEQGLLVRIECHCKDCKHVDFAGCKNGTCYCYMNECYMNENDFCKYAERYKEEAEQKLAEMKGE